MPSVEGKILLFICGGFVCLFYTDFYLFVYLVDTLFQLKVSLILLDINDFEHFLFDLFAVC